MDFGAVSWIGVVLSAVVFFAIGGVYYGPVFGSTWMRAVGMTEEDAAGANMPLLFGGTFVLQAAAAVGLGMFIGDGASTGDGVLAGLVAGVLLVATTLGVLSLYERRSPTLWALNAGYNVLGFAATGAILGWLQ